MSRAIKTAYELEDMIVERARTRHGPWPDRMTLFVFDDAYGWSVTVSRAACEHDSLYRSAALDIVFELKSAFDLAAPRLPKS
jgi:hypothetical protein